MTRFPPSPCPPSPTSAAAGGRRCRPSLRRRCPPDSPSRGRTRTRLPRWPPRRAPVRPRGPTVRRRQCPDSRDSSRSSSRSLVRVRAPPVPASPPPRSGPCPPGRWPYSRRGDPAPSRPPSCIPTRPIPNSTLPAKQTARARPAAALGGPKTSIRSSPRRRRPTPSPRPPSRRNSGPPPRPRRAQPTTASPISEASATLPTSTASRSLPLRRRSPPRAGSRGWATTSRPCPLPPRRSSSTLPRLIRPPRASPSRT
mmetsp:Transcript_53272/g.159490  ORF Transcript_53272/g.159490 Transcript_53272/m.159490 type:complete len:255 (+) Transcript_53272:1702-2466(+)